MSPVRGLGPWCSAAIGGARLEDMSWLVFDVETSGLDPGRHAIREYAACAVSTTRETSMVTAWSSEEDGPEDFVLGLAEVAAALRAGMVLVAHNLAFELAFLATRPDAPDELVRPDRWLCTLRMLPAPESLDALAARLGVPIEGRHTAVGDVRTLAGVLVALMDRAEASEIDALGDMAAVVPSGRRLPSESRVNGRPVSGWEGVRRQIDHVVPCALVSRDQRAAFRAAIRLLADRRAGPLHPLENDALVVALRGAGITASGLDVLLSELTGSVDT